jgi:hypothetical protein
MANKLTKFLTQNQVTSVVNDNEDIYSNCVDVESSIKFHTFAGQHLFNFTTTSYPTFEPDHDKVKVWIRARNTGTTIRDLSGYNNTAYLYGDPIMVDGLQDIGCNTNGTKSLAIRFNRTTSPYENQEYISIPDSANTQIDELVTGHSEFIRFKIYSLADQGGLSPTLFEKVDDSTPVNARMLQIRNNGALLYVVLDGGTAYAKLTPADTIIPNIFEDIDPYDVFTSYNASTHEIKIYLDGVSQTLTTFTGQINWQEDETLHDMSIFRRGYGSTGGYVYGDFYDYHNYMEKIVTQQEVTNHFTNKWTIWAVPFGQCMVVDHFATYAGSGGAGTASFTTNSFDTSSFST